MNGFDTNGHCCFAACLLGSIVECVAVGTIALTLTETKKWINGGVVRYS